LTTLASGIQEEEQEQEQQKQQKHQKQEEEDEEEQQQQQRQQRREQQQKEPEQKYILIDGLFNLLSPDNFILFLITDNKEFLTHLRSTIQSWSQ